MPPSLQETIEEIIAAALAHIADDPAYKGEIPPNWASAIVALKYRIMFESLSEKDGITLTPATQRSNAHA